MMETTFSLCGCFQEGQRRLQVESDSFEISGSLISLRPDCQQAQCIFCTFVLQTQSKHHLDHNWRVLLIVCAKMLNFNPVTMKQRGLKHFNNTYSASNTRL